MIRDFFPPNSEFFAEFFSSPGSGSGQLHDTATVGGVLHSVQVEKNLNFVQEKVFVLAI